MALTAGIFEEVGRYLGINFLMSSLTFKTGVALGLGHGGLESILFVGFTQINNILYSFKINRKIFNEEIGSQLPEGQAEKIKNKLLETSPIDYILGGIERVFAIIIQIVLSLIIVYGIANGKMIYLIYAILLHILTDAPAAYIKFKKYSPWITEVYLLILSSLGLFVLYMKHFP